jgi:hypothetical protein
MDLTSNGDGSPKITTEKMELAFAGEFDRSPCKSFGSSRRVALRNLYSQRLADKATVALYESITDLTNGYFGTSSSFAWYQGPLRVGKNIGFREVSVANTRLARCAANSISC